MEKKTFELQAELEHLKKQVQAGRKALIEAAMRAENLNGTIQEALRLHEGIHNKKQARTLKELSRALQKTSSQAARQAGSGKFTRDDC